jgi:peptide-methionine (S)-S-oxide reductase
MQTDIKLEKATLGNGCFWCTEAIFQQLKGVASVVSGYSGGHDPSPDYKKVCSGSTGHAECLEINYDPAIISFAELLEVFFSTHDPTSLNRQGEDIGTQYRSVIFHHNTDQLETSQAYIKQINESGKFPKAIVTTLEPYTLFHPAEDYHHNYFQLNGHNPYCRLVVKPKVEKFIKKYDDKLK